MSNEKQAGHPGFLALLDEMRALHQKKAADYGSDRDPLVNIRASAEIGVEPWKNAWLRAKDKVKRIDQYCLKGSLENEGVEDSLMDLAAYCLIALALRREESSGQRLPDAHRRRLLVYVAGPISKGNITDNIRRAHDAGMALLKAGIACIVPHGSCFWGNSIGVAQSWNGGCPFWPDALPAGTTHEDWYGMDLEIVRRCDAVLRLPGESAGVDAEVAEAQRCRKWVFHSVGEVIAWAKAGGW